MGLPQKKNVGIRLPAELRNAIYRLTLCCHEEVHLNKQEKFERQFSSSSEVRKSLTPSLLRVSRQIYEEAISILYGENKFCVTVDESGQHRNKYVSPALWKKETRQCVYRIRTLGVNVELRREYDLVNSMEVVATNTAMVSGLKIKFKAIVQDVLQELCNALGMSESLREIDIRFVNRGLAALTDGKEHDVLEPFLRLRRLNRVTCSGVPTKFAGYIEHTMRQDKNE